MKIYSTPLGGLKLIEIARRADERGFFARIFCGQELSKAGLMAAVAQINTSFNGVAGTLRGLRYQLPPAAETKIVRCMRGAMFDFAVDLRPDSPTYQRWFGSELNDSNGMMIYVPRGFAHGYITLMDRTEVLYIVSEYYSPEHERGIRFDDPAFRIELPRSVAKIAPKDCTWPNFAAERGGSELFRGMV